jgi:hypothetical protein
MLPRMSLSMRDGVGHMQAKAWAMQALAWWLLLCGTDTPRRPRFLARHRDTSGHFVCRPAMAWIAKMSRTIAEL